MLKRLFFFFNIFILINMDSYAVSNNKRISQKQLDSFSYSSRRNISSRGSHKKPLKRGYSKSFWERHAFKVILAMGAISVISTIFAIKYYKELQTVKSLAKSHADEKRFILGQLRNVEEEKRGILRLFGSYSKELFLERLEKMKQFFQNFDSSKESGLAIRLKGHSQYVSPFSVVNSLEDQTVVDQKIKTLAQEINTKIDQGINDLQDPALNLRDEWRGFLGMGSSVLTNEQKFERVGELNGYKENINAALRSIGLTL